MLRYIRDKVFISYSHEDEEWLNRIQIALKHLERDNKVVVWHDKKIKAGAKWKDEILEALESAKVAILLVSQNFLASDFIAKHELPLILEASAKDELKILWVAISYCPYEDINIGNYQAINNPDTPLNSLSSHEQDKVLTKLSREIKIIIENPIHPSLPDVDDELGPAISGILRAAPSPYGTRGFTRRYLKGSIYLITEKGVPAVSRPTIKNNTFFRVHDSLIGKRYESHYGTGSILGFPLENMNKACDNNLRDDCTFSGHVQWFEGGNIYQLERFGAHIIYAGKIFDKFVAYEEAMKKSGREFMTGGELGFPISNQQEVVSRSGAKGIAQRFIYGCIISWSGGVYGITQGFYDLYQSIGEWNGELGFPLSHVEKFVPSVSGKEGWIQRFENGCTLWNDRDFYIYGPIYNKWQEDRDKLGFALNSECVTKNCHLQNFEGGKIEHRYDGSTNTILK
jgi:hypothetical protein